MKLKLRQWPVIVMVMTLSACQMPIGAVATPTSIPPTIDVAELPTPTFPIAADFAYSGPLVDLLIQAGVEVQSVGPSMLGGYFDVPRLAVWIQTDRGIVEAVYLDNPTEASVISIVPFDGSTEEQYLYQVQALPPLLSDELIIDSAYPLYHLIHAEMLIETASEELYDILVDELTS